MSAELSIPALPQPAEIKAEIERLQARIRELRVVLPLAEAQHGLRRTARGRDDRVERGPE